MNMVVKFFEIQFSGENTKEAYLECCRWIAENVLKVKVETGDILEKITKVSDTSFPTFKLELYATLDEKKFREGFCNRCQEFHKAFYLNQQYNCDACNMVAYLKQMEERLKIVKGYRKDQLK